MTRDRRRGFTLIELMVAIGIILLLVSIAIIGYQKLDKVAGDKATQTRLALCASILSEYETAATLVAIEGPSVPPALFAAGSPEQATPDPKHPEYGNVNVGGGMRYGGVVYNTAKVLNLLLQVPSSKTMIGQLPGNAMLSTTTGTNVAGVAITTGWFDQATNGSIALPVVVDAWKNPIIYVPSGGLTNVFLGRQISTALQTKLPAGSLVTVKSVDNRPFWASAGQDGNFVYGDDNLYSCPVVYVPQPPPGP